LAADARDPRVGAGQRALERRDLGVAAAVLRPRPRTGRVLYVDTNAEALLEGAPRLQRLGEEHAGVDGHHARVRRSAEQLVEDDRPLLLEREQDTERLGLG